MLHAAEQWVLVVIYLVLYALAGDDNCINSIELGTVLWWSCIRKTTVTLWPHARKCVMAFTQNVPLKACHLLSAMHALHDLGGAGLIRQKGRELLLLLPMQPVRGKEGTAPDYWFFLVPCTHASPFTHARRTICPVVCHKHRHKLDMWLQVMSLPSSDLLSDIVQLLTMSAITNTPSGMLSKCTTFGIVLLYPCGIPSEPFHSLVFHAIFHFFV